jgi:hypothetical protein
MALEDVKPPSAEGPQIIVDFDGVIHRCDLKVVPSEWDSTIIPGDLMPGALTFLQGLVDSGYKVVISTARTSQNPHDHLFKRQPEEPTREAIYKWMLKVGLPIQLVDKLCIAPSYWGKPGAALYIDDKGFRFEGIFPSMDQVKALIKG